MFAPAFQVVKLHGHSVAMTHGHRQHVSDSVCGGSNPSSSAKREPSEPRSGDLSHCNRVRFGLPPKLLIDRKTIAAEVTSLISAAVIFITHFVII